MSKKEQIELQFNLKRDEALAIALISRCTLSKFVSQGELLEGIHFVKAGKEYLWCEYTLNHWRNCGRDRNHADHLDLIERIARSKSSNRRRPKSQVV